MRAAALLSLGPAAACGGVGPDREAIRAEAARLDPDLHCTDTSGLWPAEVQGRKKNRYVDRSPHELQFCFNCANYIAPQTPGCGACRTVKGPINPGAWCNTWTEKR